jgi:hypothetical protein
MTQKAFAALLDVHVNTVCNAERRGSASHDYLRRLAALREVNLHWLLTGEGAMRVTGVDASLLQETLGLALADALRGALGPRYASVPLATRARAIRAAATYLRAIGVTEATIPGAAALARLVKLTLDVMRREASL